jgi:hypothetical protein
VIKDEGLKAYADLLESHGFAIYEPIGSMGTYFLYSREVDAQECFGYVQVEYFGGYSQRMPIKPSKENGSAITVSGVRDELTVEAARAIAKPTNRGAYVNGAQQNYEDPSWLARSYVKRDPKGQS